MSIQRPTKVGEGPGQAVCEAVFGAPRAPRPVIDRDLHDAGALHLEQGGQESVQAGEEFQPVEVLPPVDLEAAPDVQGCPRGSPGCG